MDIFSEKGLLEMAESIDSITITIKPNKKFVDILKDVSPKNEKHILINPTIPIPKDTLVWMKDNNSLGWSIGYYSHFENNNHYVFKSQKKSSQTKEFNSWEIVVTKNPL